MINTVIYKGNNKKSSIGFNECYNVDLIEVPIQFCIRVSMNVMLSYI